MFTVKALTAFRSLRGASPAVNPPALQRTVEEVDATVEQLTAWLSAYFPKRQILAPEKIRELARLVSARELIPKLMEASQAAVLECLDARVGVNRVCIPILEAAKRKSEAEAGSHSQPGAGDKQSSVAQNF